MTINTWLVEIVVWFVKLINRDVFCDRLKILYRCQLIIFILFFHFFTNFDIQKFEKFHTENFRIIIYVNNSYIYKFEQKINVMIQQELA